MTRYPPLDNTHWPAEIADMQAGFAGRLNVYRVMAHHPALLRAWADLRDHVVVKTALGPELSEVVILRAAHWIGSDYEWAHHVSRARALGFEDHRIARLAGPIDEITGQDQTIARAVDALMTTRAIPPQMQGPLEAEIGKEGIFDLIATVGFYSTLGFMLNSFPPPLDEAVARELRETPFLQLKV